MASNTRQEGSAAPSTPDTASGEGEAAVGGGSGSFGEAVDVLEALEHHALLYELDDMPDNAKHLRQVLGVIKELISAAQGIQREVTTHGMSRLTAALATCSSP